MSVSKYFLGRTAVLTAHLLYCIAEKKKGALHDESRLS